MTPGQAFSEHHPPLRFALQLGDLIDGVSRKGLFRKIVLQNQNKFAVSL